MPARADITAELLAHEEHGEPDAPPVVLLHGYPLDRRLWAAQHELRDACRLILPDLPGFGRTPLGGPASLERMADRLAALLDALAVPRAAVLGHSMGGYVALAFAERHPGRLSGFGLVCSHAAADSPEARAQRQETVRRVREEGSGFVAEAMRPRLFAAETLARRAALVARFVGIMREASPEAVTNALEAMAARPDRTAVLSTIRVPALVVAGEEDRIVPLARAEETARLLPDGALYRVAGAGHMAMAEQPDGFNRAVRELIGRTRAG